MIGRKQYDPESIFRGTKFPNQSPYLSQIHVVGSAVYFPNSRSSFKWKKSWEKIFY